MDKFAEQVVELINKEVDNRVKEIMDERIGGIVRGLSSYLDIGDITNVTGLTIDEVRGYLQVVVDQYNKVMMLCGKPEELQTIESLLYSKRRDREEFSKEYENLNEPINEMKEMREGKLEKITYDESMKDFDKE